MAQLNEVQKSWVDRFLGKVGGNGAQVTMPADSALLPDGMISPLGAPMPLVSKLSYFDHEDAGGGGGGGGGGSSSGGASGGAKQASPTAGSAKGREIPYSIPVSKPMDNLEFSILVDITVLKMSRDKAIENNKNPKNRVQPSTFVVTQEHVKQGFVIVHYHHSGLAPANPDADKKAEESYNGYSEEKQDDINNRTNDRFWKTTGYKEGKPLDPKDPNFKAMSQAWTQFRTDVIEELKRWERIPPEALKFFKFRPDGIKLTAENIDRIVAIAEKVKGLSEDAMADYWARTNASTTDIDVFARSVDDYLEHLKDRTATSEALNTAHNKLVGKEKLFSMWKKANRGYRATSVNMKDPDSSEFNKEWNRETDKFKAEFAAALKEWGYANEAAFVKDIGEYRAAFQKESVAIANDGMERREHELWAFEQEVVTDGNLRGMMAALQGINAKREQLEKNSLITSKADRMAALKQDVLNAINRDPNLKKLIELRQQEDPNYQIDDEMIDLLSAAKNENDLKARIQSLLNERRDGIAQTRHLLAEEPDKIWQFDMALARSKAMSQAQPNSIQDQIIGDHLKRIQRKDLGKKIAIGAAAIVAGLLTFGKGTIAVLGAAAAVGLGSYGVWDQYTTYAEEDAANLAGLSSKDPSFAWVVISLATLPLDVLGLASSIKAAAKGAHIAKILASGSETGDAVRTFNSGVEAVQSADDVAKVVAKLEKDLAKAHKSVREAIIKSARAEAEANAAWAAAKAARKGRAAGYIDPVVTPLLDLAAAFAYPVCLSIRKGIKRVDVFLKTKYARDLIKNADALSAPAMKNVAEAFEMARRDWGRIAQRVVDLGIDNKHLDDALAAWGKTPDMPTDKFISDILEPTGKLQKKLDLARADDAVGGGRASGVQRQTTPVQASGPVHNTTGRGTVPAPDSVLDPASRRVLRGHGAPSMSEDVAGTGGIETIKAGKVAGTSDGQTFVEVGGEILPGRLQRNPKNPVRSGQSRAPNFNRSKKMPPVEDLGFANPANWERLHLWGPGFGDEAAAGMFVGPRLLNQELQNRGIEDLIRELGRQVAPHRRAGYKLKVKARAETWGRPTPGGFQTKNGELLVREVRYDVVLETPAGTKSARIEFSVQNDPALINAGSSPAISVNIDTPAFNSLFEALPK
jgi:hypothetical protein